jgi:hypothetical protein
MPRRPSRRPRLTSVRRIPSWCRAGGRTPRRHPSSGTGRPVPGPTISSSWPSWAWLLVRREECGLLCPCAALRCLRPRCPSRRKWLRPRRRRRFRPRPRLRPRHRTPLRPRSRRRQRHRLNLLLRSQPRNRPKPPRSRRPPNRDVRQPTTRASPAAHMRRRRKQARPPRLPRLLPRPRRPSQSCPHRPRI